MENQQDGIISPLTCINLFKTVSGPTSVISVTLILAIFLYFKYNMATFKGVSLFYFASTVFSLRLPCSAG